MSHLNRQERIGTGLAAGSMLLVGGSVAASSLLDGYPVLGGQGVRYLAAGLLLAAWARLRHKPLPRPAGREWAWLAGLAVIGLAGCSVLLIEATRVADPASVGVIIGAARDAATSSLPGRLTPVMAPVEPLSGPVDHASRDSRSRHGRFIRAPVHAGQVERSSSSTRWMRRVRVSAVRAPVTESTCRRWLL